LIDQSSVAAITAV